jgi:hypothetical protein
LTPSILRGATIERLRRGAGCANLAKMHPQPSYRCHRPAIVLLAIAGFIAAVVLPSPAAAGEPAIIATHQRHQKKSFTDSQIVDGFLKTAFGAEYHLAGRVDRIRKYEKPVRIFVDGAAAVRKKQIAKVVDDIGRRVQHLDIAMAETTGAANVTVKLVRDRDLYPTLASFYGVDRANEIRTSLDPQCLSGFRKNDAFEIERSDVILTTDNGDFTFLDCAYEELLQSLGPINDTSSVPWTMFNDNVSMGFFDIYDQYLLNILYDPRIKAGMTVQQVRAVLPQVLTDVRLWVAKVNDLPPE